LELSDKDFISARLRVILLFRVEKSNNYNKSEEVSSASDLQDAQRKMKNIFHENREISIFTMKKKQQG
jgi:hypothetical protein